eukprot:CAMPEP_0185734548 /NCGR_PEP_ID=MMETSP1171-20130828/22843_1 /TAXON_ID=374046 /ORGANISM="Helicotheca tamensis, Strain CCMP826" /LENGTH=132 /DNA_ID=CAMNT_0028404565 /DNA_START=207 /DNA_END=605 /DNA_ORIENTATION=-
MGGLRRPTPTPTNKRRYSESGVYPSFQSSSVNAHAHPGTYKFPCVGSRGNVSLPKNEGLEIPKPMSSSKLDSAMHHTAAPSFPERAISLCCVDSPLVDMDKSQGMVAMAVQIPKEKWSRAYSVEDTRDHLTR